MATRKWTSGRTVGVVLAAMSVIGSSGCEANSPSTAEPSQASGAGAAMLTSTLLFGTAEPLLSNAEVIRLEEAIAECMAESGFSYVADERPTSLAPQSSGDLFADGYGLGISTRYFSRSSVPDTTVLAAEDDAGRSLASLEEEVDDSGLTFEEQDAYLEALEGPDGCEERAFGEAGLEVANFSFDDEEAFEELVALAERVAADPVVSTEFDRIGRCLGEQGAEVSQFADAVSRIDEHMAEFENGIDRFVDGTTLNPAGLDRLRQIQEEELRLAEALEVCGALPHQANPEVVSVTERYVEAYQDQ